MLSNESASEFASKHYNEIYAFCCSRLKNTEDARDVTQDVFLLFQQKLQTLEDVNIRAWLFSVANKKIMQEYRKRMSKNKIVLLSDEQIDERDELICNFDDYCYVDGDFIEAVREKILLRLAPAERELFLQIYEKRKKYSEIASELNIGEKAVNLRSYRLRVKIKSMAEVAFMLLIYGFVRLK